LYTTALIGAAYGGNKAAELVAENRLEELKKTFGNEIVNDHTKKLDT
jgi:hypothetical protein